MQFLCSRKALHRCFIWKLKAQITRAGTSQVLAAPGSFVVAFDLGEGTAGQVKALFTSHTEAMTTGAGAELGNAERIFFSH